MAPTLKVDLSGRLRDLGRLLTIFQEFAAIQRIPVAVRREAHLALDEILSNVIYYGSPTKRPCQIRVEATLSRGVLRLCVTDDGRPFNPLSAPEPDTSRPVTERALGGLGIAIVKKTMDRVQYSRRHGRNRLILIRAVNNRR
jgi:anti-sigma regulatory factor (Ser/Thr protein kinase)